MVTRDPTAVEVEVQSVYLAMFPDTDRMFVPQIFGWVIDCFTGQYDDYQAIDAKYHDFEHTLQGTLCLARILDGRRRRETQPAISQKLFELGLLAILLHDTGYLKKRWDTEGTGAKYTVTHVRRSAEFAAELLVGKGYPPAEIKTVQNMIFCTGVNAVLDKIPFQSEPERIVGYILGTADLLGQMAASDYVDKLPVLYAEFAEAARHDRDKTSVVGMFSSAMDLLLKTPVFWEKYVRVKLDKDFGGVYRFLDDASGRNDYLDRIDANVDLIRRHLAIQATKS